MRAFCKVCFFSCFCPGVYRVSCLCLPSSFPHLTTAVFSINVPDQNQEINSKSINKQWNSQKENNKRIHPPAYCDIKEKAITRNECVFRLTSFIQETNGPQPAPQTRDAHQLLNGKWLCPRHFPAVIDEWQHSNGEQWLKVHMECSGSQVAHVCVQLRALTWCVGVSSWRRRQWCQEMQTEGQDSTDVSRRERAQALTPVGPDHSTFRTSLRTSCLFFAFPLLLQSSVW